jgi:hypothetical protein
MKRFITGLILLYAVGFLNATDGTAPKYEGAPRLFTSLADLQSDCYTRFVNTPGFGMSRMEPIHKSMPPTHLILNQFNYQVSPPELIGLETKPIVYLSFRDNLAKSDFVNPSTRRLMKTRGISAAETSGLASLRSGANLVIVTNAADQLVAVAPPASLRALGAIRAGSQCAKCHACENDSLLGAFSYQLTLLAKPPGPATNPPPAESQTTLKSTELSRRTDNTHRSKL